MVGGEGVPLVLRKDGFRVYIDTQDHEPYPVHVKNAEAEITINLKPLEIREIENASNRLVRQAWELVEENCEFLISEWERIKPVP